MTEHSFFGWTIPLRLKITITQKKSVCTVFQAELIAYEKEVEFQFKLCNYVILIDLSWILVSFTHEVLLSNSVITIAKRMFATLLTV